MRGLLVKNGIVVNIIEFGDVLPDEAEGCTVVPDNGSNVGDDAKSAIDDAKIDRMDLLAFKELFRLTNEVRALQGKSQITAAQYRAALKALL